MNTQFVPESAPFTPEQRAWLNGFLSGVLGQLDQSQPARGGSADALAAAAALMSPSPGVSSTATESDEAFPWHDSTLPIGDRMKLAEGKPKARRLMAAMAQLNCGSCGYLCKTYAEAIANGSEKNTTLCSPGGSETAKMLRQVAKEPDANPAGSNEHKPIVAPKLSGTRENPTDAKLLASIRLNGSGSAKDTRHVEIDLTGTQLQYHVGDALGIVPQNCNELVTNVIAAAKLDSLATVSVSDQTMPIATALQSKCLRTIPSELLAACVSYIEERPKQNGSVAIDAALLEKLKSFEDSDAFDQWDVLEFFESFQGIKIPPQLFIDALQPIRPRLYSIASSQAKHPNQVHLTVGRVENRVRDRARKGVASTMLADRLAPGATLKVFIQKSHGFTVPSDPNAPMIMVGPGTGIAPFMAFLQQRESDNATGRNWLFFGDQKSDCDFLYREQLQSWTESGLLTRLDLAFSRDTDTKVYVQHRMEEAGAELFSWLEAGGYFFVCGDASRMAVDVDKSLHQIIVQHGNRSADQAKLYVANLAKSKRYVRDVY